MAELTVAQMELERRAYEEHRLRYMAELGEKRAELERDAQATTRAIAARSLELDKRAIELDKRVAILAERERWIEQVGLKLKGLLES